MPFFKPSPAISIHYIDENPDAVDTVLLLHGLGATCTSWQLQIPPLTGAGFRCIAPDVSGFGQSNYAGGGTSVAKLAQPIHGLLSERGIDCAYVVGISMGGTLALQMALDYPQQVKKLVLVNTFAHLQIASARLWPYYLLRFILVHTLGLRTQARTVALRIFPRPEQEVLRQALIEQILQADPRGYRAAMRALARFDVRDRLAEIKMPALVVTGENDTTVLPPNQHLLADGIAQARQVVIPLAGHALTVEQPELFNQILFDFLCS
jgi:3-oxoadipate enol-lactonase